VGLASIDTAVREDTVAFLRRTDALRAAIDRAVDTFGTDTETAAAVRAASEAVPETRAEFYAAVLALIPPRRTAAARRAERLRLLARGD
jgi:hypothetical protein